MRLILKRCLHWGGSVLAIAGIAFVALRLHDYGAQIDFSRFGMAEWGVIVVFSLIYGLSNLMLVLAWWNLLGRFGVSINYAWAVRTYGTSQIAKYVPGNIFHLAGRQAIGVSTGMAGWPLAKSMVWELGLISGAGGLFGLLALPLLLPSLPVTASSGMFVVVIGITAVFLSRFLGPLVARAFGWHAGFLALSGILFVGLIKLLSATSLTGLDVWLMLGGAYVMAWLAGLVTPGAPAGVGVRELVLLFLLKGIVSEADLLLAVVLGRLVTVTGDLLFFAAASLVRLKEDQNG